MKAVIALLLIAAGLAGCASAHTTSARLPDGSLVANVHSGKTDLFGGSETVSTFVCKPPRRCEHVASGGGTNNGVAVLAAPAISAGGFIIAAGQSSGTSIGTTVITKANAGSGNSNVKVLNTNVNENTANAKNTNVGVNKQ